jgi:hypothetical protein
MMFDAGGSAMRTTLSIDDDVLSAAKEMANAQNRTMGEIISSLARLGLNPTESRRQMRNGIPLLPVRANAKRVTSELVQKLREELH